MWNITEFDYFILVPDHCYFQIGQKLFLLLCWAKWGIALYLDICGNLHPKPVVLFQVNFEYRSLLFSSRIGPITNYGVFLSVDEETHILNGHHPHALMT